MPTKHPRIAIVRDHDLDAALSSVRDLRPENAPAAAVVHDLAIRGAQAVRADADERRRLRLELAEPAASERPPWDPDVLADVDRLAWGDR